LIGLTRLSLAADVQENVSGIIEAILTNLREQTQIPAYSVAIVQDGQVLARTAVGEVDLRNHIDASPETQFRLASVSKTIGATMLALLVQQGKLDPNGPVGAHLPELASQLQNLTPLQLLSHTSGLPHYQAQDILIAETHYKTAIEALETVGDRPLTGTPGDSYSYSSHGYTILSALYEAISGEPLRVSAPAFIKALSGRDSPALEDLQRRDSRRSNVFAVDSDGTKTLKPRNQLYSPFGTGFVASATDLAYFGDAVLHSSKIDMDTRELLFRPVALSGGGKTGNYLYEVAFGWRVGTDSSDRTVYHHAGVTQGARSVLILYPDFGLSIAFLSNAAWTAQIEHTGFSIANIVLEQQSSVTLNRRYSFTGSFNGVDVAGSISCDESSAVCRLSDNLGAFSKWLMQYSPNKEREMGWPSLMVQGDDGYVLKIITSVGVVEMHRAFANPDYDHFKAELSDNRELVIHFSEKFLQ